MRSWHEKARLVGRGSASVLGVLALACGPSPDPGADGDGGTTATGGTSSASGGASSGAQECAPVMPARTSGADRTWSLPLDILVQDTPLTLGEEFQVTARPYKLTMLKFFLAEPSLTTGNGETIPVQFVSENGAPVPYNLVLVDAEQPASLTLSLAVPPGDFASLELALGLPAPCNAFDPTVSVFPLSFDADMYWPWGEQYMFQKVQGEAFVNGAWQPLAYHVGFDSSYRRLALNYPLEFGVGSPQARLTFHADAFFAAPSGVEVPLTNHTVAPDWTLENLVTDAFSLVLKEDSP